MVVSCCSNSMVFEMGCRGNNWNGKPFCKRSSYSLHRASPSLFSRMVNNLYKKQQGVNNENAQQN